MTDAAWETFSNQAIAAAGVVYFLALLAHLVEWSALRATGESLAAASTGGGARATTGAGGVAVAVGGAGQEPGQSAGQSPGLTGSQSPAESTRSALFGRLGLLLTGLGCAVHGLGLLGRGLAADPNRVPWGNMYEFTVSGTFVVALLYLVLYRRFQLTWLGPLVVTFVVAVLMVAVVWLYDPVSPLTEALNSPWLVIHVVAAVLATGAFTLGGFTSALFLLKERAIARGRTGGYTGRLPEPAVLDRISYRIHAFGFPVWTFAVLITGPIWAHQAWSSYWSWDPKEVWAFITWVVYAAYLHARSTAGWRGRKAAWLALAGVATLWFNFIGINYFSTTSQHSYAAASHQPGGPTARA